jgi:hypothetical protein
MATILKAGNVATGAQITSDATGILEVRTGTGAGTTAITVGTDQAVTMAGRTTNPTTISVGNTTPSTSGAGITFPATQSASSNANTLDDYEEGTWTPSSFAGSTNVTSISWSAGSYTKVGRLVTLIGEVNCTVTSSNTLTFLIMIGTPFATSISTCGGAFLNNNIRSGSSQVVTASNTAYAFFSAASAPVAGSEIIQFSITYPVP